MVAISNPVRYKAGLYVRLSNEAIESTSAGVTTNSVEAEMERESGSITNQKRFLKDFCSECGIEIYKIYADDGYSGSLGIWPEGSVQLLLGAVGVNKGGFQAHLLHGHREQVEAATVNCGAGHNMVAAAGNIEYRHEVGSLTGRSQHSGCTTLQRADFGRHCITGGICQTGIKIALCLQIKELAHILGCGILEGSALNDGDLAGFAVTGSITGLNAQSFGAQFLHRKSPHIFLEI